MSKKLDTLVDDIYSKLSVLSEGEGLELSEEQLDSFGKDMAEALKHWASPHTQPRNTLRMSNIGKPLRRLWYDMKEDSPQEVISPSLQIKFLYGHLLEVLLLFFVRLAGHEVTDEQKEIKVSGIKGHMDCKINGQVVDVKTASGYAFKKFKDGTLAEDDPFGYMAQLAGYESAEGTKHGGFLALNKESGELAMFRPDNFDKPNIKNKIKDIKKAVKLSTPPDKCYNTVPDGKSGNMKLAKGCTWCRFKFDCHQDANEGKGLRVFKYSTGYRYLTQVPKPPNVIEVTQI